MAELNYRIPNDELAEDVAAYCRIYPNIETIPDPSNPKAYIPKYTDVQWVREHIRAFLNLTVKRGKKMLYQDTFTSTESNIT